MLQHQSNRWYLRWYSWVIAGVVILFLLLPTLFSSAPGKKILLNIIREATGYNLEIKSLSLSWLGPQQAYGITFKDEKRHIIFTCTEIQTEAPLWKVSSFDVTLSVHQGTLQIVPPGLPPIVFQEIDIFLTVPQKDLPLIFSMTGKTKDQNTTGSFIIKGQISGLNTNQLQGNVETQINKLPLAGIDQLLELKGSLVELIGTTIDLNLTAHSVKDGISFNIKALSSQLSAEIATISEKNSLELKAPAQVILKITPKFASRFSLGQLKEDAQLTATISRLSCPLSEDGLEFKKLAFNATVNVEPADFSNITLNHLQAQLSSENINEKINVVFDASSPQFTLSTVTLSIAKDIKLTAPFHLTCTIHNEDQLSLNIATLTLPLPLDLKKMQMQADANLPSWDINTHVVANTWDSIELSVKGKNFTTDISAKIDNETFTIKKPFTIRAFLTNELIQPYFKNITLVQPEEIKIDLQPLLISFKNFDVNQFQGQGRAYTNQLLLTSKFGSKQFYLKNIEMLFSLNGNKQTANFSLASTVEDGTLTADLSFTQFSLTNINTATVIANCKIQNLPSSFIDTLIAGNISLQTVLGNTLDLTFNLNSTQKKQTFLMSAKSPNLYFSGNFLLQDDLLQLQAPGMELNVVVTEKSYFLIDNGPLKLKQPAVCSLQIEEMQWPVLTNKKTSSLLERIPVSAFNWNLMRFKGELLLKELEYQQFTLSNTKLNFEKRENISFDLNSNLSPQGQINVTGEMTGAHTSQIKVHAFIKDFPTIILDLFSRLLGQSDISFLPVFGKTLNVQVGLDLNDFNGPITLNLTSDNTRISCAGNIDHGYLTLSESLYAQVLMTPELSALILKQLNPLSIKEITSKSPITLEINSYGFLLPIQPFDPSKLFINKAKLELGKISCRNEGNINTTLSLLKWTKTGKGDTLKLWFAPCDFSIKQGIVTIQRTEILLADSLDIALWGDIDLPQHYVKTTLGLTASALSTAFGLKKLPKDYVLQVPMRGPMDNVTIDTSSATTKIALLLAWQQKDLATSLGGSKGSFFGGLIDKVVPLPDFDTKAPPAKHPFPWEGAQKEKTSSSSIKKGDKPLKQLLKILK